MPELPEVEITRRNLERWLVGRVLTGLDIFHPRAFPQDSAQEAPIGQELLSASRRGKAIYLAASDGGGLLIRLGMTGRFVLERKEEPIPRFARLALLYREGTVFLVDSRCLGSVRPVKVGAPNDVLRAAVPGIDPVLDGLSGKDLEQIFEGKSRPVKVLLLEQSGVAGIGNIYASESLYEARIDPRRVVSSLSPEECQRLADAIREVLHRAIRDFDGEDLVYFSDGGLENPFRVYQRAGLSCARCSEVIVRLVQSGRSTFYCSRCQD